MATECGSNKSYVCVGVTFSRFVLGGSSSCVWEVFFYVSRGYLVGVFFGGAGWWVWCLWG